MQTEDVVIREPDACATRVDPGPSICLKKFTPSHDSSETLSEDPVSPEKQLPSQVCLLKKIAELQNSFNATRSRSFRRFMVDPTKRLSLTEMLGVENSELDQAGPPKRPKERSIKEVIDALYLWKRLQEGVCTTDATSNQKILVRYDAWEAAKHVRVSKRTLDDYLM